MRRASSLELEVSFDAAAIDRLSNREIEIIYRLTDYPKILAEAAREYSPAVVAQFVYDLAKEYNGFYQEVPIFNEEDKNKLAFRVALSQQVARLIKKSMELLGIAVPERM